MKHKIMRILAGLLGAFLIITIVSLASSSMPKDFMGFSAYFGGFLLGIVFLVYAVKGRSIVNR